MKIKKLGLKSKFLSVSKVFCLLSLMGCSQALYNVTPEITQRNPSHLYRFTTQCDVDEYKTVPGTFKPSLVIDGQSFPLKADAVAPRFYYYDYPLDAGRTIAKYYFQVDYQQEKHGRISSYVKKTPLATIKILEYGNFSLENERAPIGSEIRVLGCGFSPEDRVRLHECNATTTYLSENVLSFRIPAVVPGSVYPVYVVCKGNEIFVGNLLVDSNRFMVEPSYIEISTGEKIEFTVQIAAVLNEELYIDITTDVPSSVIMPEVRLAPGENHATVTIEGGEVGKGYLYVSAPGFEEIVVPIQVK